MSVDSRRMFIGGGVAALLGGMAVVRRDGGSAAPLDAPVGSFYPQVRRVAQQQSGRRDAVIRSLNVRRRSGWDGSQTIAGRHAESGLTFENTVHPPGQGGVSKLVLTGKDGQSVTISADTEVNNGLHVRSLEVGSPRGFAHLTAASGDEDWIRARDAMSILAVRQFRGLSAALEDDGEDETPESIALAFPGALVGLLDGDRGAVRHLAHRLNVHAGLTTPTLQTPQIQKTNYVLGSGPHIVLAQDGEFKDCWGMYTRALMDAWDQYVSCVKAVSEQWWNVYGRELCEFEYLMRSQSYWWQFIACSAVPF